MAYWRLSDRAQIVPGPPEQAQEQAAGGNGDEQASIRAKRSYNS